MTRETFAAIRIYFSIILLQGTLILIIYYFVYHSLQFVMLNLRTYFFLVTVESEECCLEFEPKHRCRSCHRPDSCMVACCFGLLTPYPNQKFWFRSHSLVRSGIVFPGVLFREFDVYCLNFAFENYESVRRHSLRTIWILRGKDVKEGWTTWMMIRGISLFTVDGVWLFWYVVISRWDLSYKAGKLSSVPV